MRATGCQAARTSSCSKTRPANRSPTRCAWRRTHSSSATVEPSSASRRTPPKSVRSRSPARSNRGEKTMRFRFALIALASLVAACGAASTPQAASGDKLYEAMSTGHDRFISVIDARSHQQVRRLPLGVASGDWQHLYSLDSTSLVDTDPLTGATRARLDLQHAYTLPNATSTGLPGGLSQNGRWLALQRYDLPDGANFPTASHVVVVDTSTMRMAKRVDLDGFFDFDAISNDGVRLYVIQFVNGKEYFVRVYDTRTGKLDPYAVVDKSEGGEAMAGLRLSGVATNNGGWL